KKGQPSCVLVNVDNVLGPFITSTAEPAAGDADEVSMKPARGAFSRGETVAKVGDKVILYDEIKPTVDVMLELLAAKSSVAGDEKALAARREELTKETIESAVLRKLL